MVERTIGAATDGGTRITDGEREEEQPETMPSGSQTPRRGVDGGPTITTGGGAAPRPETPAPTPPPDPVPPADVGGGPGDGGPDITLGGGGPERTTGLPGVTPQPPPTEPEPGGQRAPPGGPGPGVTAGAGDVFGGAPPAEFGGGQPPAAPTPPEPGPGLIPGAAAPSMAGGIEDLDTQSTVDLVEAGVPARLAADVRGGVAGMQSELSSSGFTSDEYDIRFQDGELSVDFDSGALADFAEQSFPGVDLRGGDVSLQDDGTLELTAAGERRVAAENLEDRLAERGIAIDLTAADVEATGEGTFAPTDEAMADIGTGQLEATEGLFSTDVFGTTDTPTQRLRQRTPAATEAEVFTTDVLTPTGTPTQRLRRRTPTAEEADFLSTDVFGAFGAPRRPEEGPPTRTVRGGGLDLPFDIGVGGGVASDIGGPATGVDRVLPGGPSGDLATALFGEPDELDTDITDRLTRGKGLFGEATERRLAENQAELMDFFSAEEEVEEAVGGVFGERVGSLAGGVATLPGFAASAPPAGFLAADLATEAAVNLPGTVQEFGAAETGEAIVETGDIAGRGVVRAAEQDPFGFAGELAGELALGIGVGRAIERAPGFVRGARIRGQGGDIFDIEDLSQPPRRVGKGRELPGFTVAAKADPDVAAREFREQARRNLLAGDEPVAFHGRAVEDVAEFGPFGRQFEAPAGTSEIPGLFQSADLSPLRLGTGAGGLLSLPSLRLPRPRLRTARVAAERGVDVDVMDPVSGFDEAAEFMQRADPSKSFIRAGRVGPTGEQEAIAPPGAMFVGTGNIFGVRAGGDVVPGRVFERGRGAGGLTPEELERFGAPGMSELSERLSQRGTPFAPTFGLPTPTPEEDVAPTGIRPRETEGPERPTAPTRADEFDVSESIFGGFATGTSTLFGGGETPTTTAPTAPTESVSSVFSGGTPTSVFGGTTAPPTTPTEPPTAPPTTPTTPPSSPPSGPPTPPATPPGTPGIPGTPFTPFTPTTPFEFPDDEPRDRDEELRLPMAPLGTEFFNPVASGLGFLFGPGAAGDGDR